MKAKTFMFPVLLFLIAGALYGQKPNKRLVPSSIDQREAVKEASFENTNNFGGSHFRNHNKSWQEGAYMNPDWQMGVIIMNDGSLIEGQHYRYDIYHQQMQFTDGKDTAAIANPEEISMIRIGARLFVYEKFICTHQMKSCYFELLEDGPCRLLKKWSCDYYQKTSDDADANCNKDLFHKDCQCFLQFGELPAQPVPLSKSDLLRLLDDEQGKIRKLMRREKLKPRRQDDLARIISYYNELRKEE